MPEARLYLYRKAGREVWDAEMWLSDGRRRVWRTGITEKSAAMVAARARLQALAAVQAAAPAQGQRSADGIAQSLAKGASGGDLVPPSGEACAPAGAAMSAPDCAESRLSAQAPSAESGGALASEAGAQAFQTAEVAKKPRALKRFDRWFFGDLASLWRAHA